MGRKINDSTTTVFTKEDAERHFQKIVGLLRELMREVFVAIGDEESRGCAATHRFVEYLRWALLKTRQDIRDAMVNDEPFLDTIPILTMYAMGIEAAWVEHPQGWINTPRSKGIIYAPELPSENRGQPVRHRRQRAHPAGSRRHIAHGRRRGDSRHRTAHGR